MFSNHLIISVLSDKEMDKIHGLSLKLLSEKGLWIGHDRMLKLLAEAGCDVDLSKKIAKFPKKVIEDFVAKLRADTSVKLGPAKSIEGCVGYFIVKMLDHETNTIRSSTKADLEKAAIIGDALPEITRINALFNPQDVPQDYSDIHMWDVVLRRCSKEICGPPILNPDSIKPIVDMCAIAAGSKEEALKRNMLFYDCYISAPLQLSKESLDLAFMAKDEGIPVTVGGAMVVASASGPITLSGSLVISNAESLAGAFMSDLMGGVPDYGAVNVTMDQSTGFACYASPDKILFSVSSCDLGHYYNLTPRIHMGFSDSCAMDMQAGIERGYTGFLQIYTYGPEVRYMPAGAIGGGKLGCLPQIIVDAEMCSMYNKFIGGIKVDDDRLAYDLIDKKGIGGVFLDSEHTVKYMRDEMWLPKMFVRKEPSIVNDDNMTSRVKAKMDDILANHDPHPLSDDQEKKIKGIVKKYS
jgi:trimethylamine--corrinoid protein Co-methyltransferase